MRIKDYFLIFTRINPSRIIKSHFGTLYIANRDPADNTSYFEIIFLALVCFAVPVSLYFGCVNLKSDLISTLLNAYAIIGGFLFSALFIFVSNYDKLRTDLQGLILADPEDLRIPEKLTLIKLNKEVYFNISFAVLLSFFNILICVIYFISPTKLSILSYICIGLLILFVHTLLMILKRMYVIFVENMDLND